MTVGRGLGAGDTIHHCQLLLLDGDEWEESHLTLHTRRISLERQCIVDLSELLFDTDYCGHDMQRLKSVSLTIPYVTGPYTVNLSQRASGGSTEVTLDQSAPVSSDRRAQKE
jgi:hypothetical protein